MGKYSKGKSIACVCAVFGLKNKFQTECAIQNKQASYCLALDCTLTFTLVGKWSQSLPPWLLTKRQVKKNDGGLTKPDKNSLPAWIIGCNF